MSMEFLSAVEAGWEILTNAQRDEHYSIAFLIKIYQLINL